MKLDFLKTLQEVQPCGLRPVMDILDESYPVMAFSDWKELAIQLIDAGFVKRHNNGQYTVTPAGKETIAQGEEFLEQALGSEQEPEEPEFNDILAGTVQAGTVQAESASSKPAPEHPWRKPLLASNPITEEIQRKEREGEEHAESSNTKISREKHPTKQELDFIKVPKENTGSALEAMSVDELLVIFNLGKEARDLIEHRLRKHCFLADEEEPL